MKENIAKAFDRIISEKKEIKNTIIKIIYLMIIFI